MFQVDLAIARTAFADEKVFRARIQDVLDDEALNLAERLQQESPVGASKGLRDGWDVQPSRLSVKVTNSSPAALFRIRGRGPGKFPPFGPNSPLAKWAAIYGIPPFLVARKIARKGTKRWQDGKNFAGIDNAGNPVRGGLIDEATKRIADRIRKEVIR